MPDQNQSLWYQPLSRIARFLTPRIMDVGDVFIPTIQVADLSYATGRPGWRGGAFTTARTPASGMRAAILLMATGGPLRVDLLGFDDDCRVTVGATATLLALGTTVATPGFVINRSGEIGFSGADAGCTAQIRVMDVDSPPAGIYFTPTDGSRALPYPLPPAFDIPSGQSMLVYGETDDEARSFTCAFSEFKDWLA